MDDPKTGSPAPDSKYDTPKVKSLRESLDTLLPAIGNRQFALIVKVLYDPLPEFLKKKRAIDSQTTDKE